MTLIHENKAAIGETIKAFDFKPMPDREDFWVAGQVVRKGDLPYKHFAIEVTTSSHDQYTVGDCVYVPMECLIIEWEDRIINLTQAA